MFRTWLLSKATSIRMRSGSVIAHELCQNAAGRLRVDERDLQTEHPAARRLVDQLHPVGAQADELRPQIVHLESDVVHAGSALCEEPPDGSVVVERREQLDAGPPHAERDGLDTLVLDALAVLDLRTEERRVRGDGRVEVLDRDADVMDR